VDIVRGEEAFFLQHCGLLEPFCDISGVRRNLAEVTFAGALLIRLLVVSSHGAWLNHFVADVIPSTVARINHFRTNLGVT
jgi:hypothetical protein